MTPDARHPRAGAAGRSGAPALGARRSSRWLSTLVLAAAGVLAVTLSPGWPRVQATSSTRPRRGRRCPAYWTGCGSTSACWSWPRSCILVLGLADRRCPHAARPGVLPVRALATAYVDLFRGVPLLIALYLVGFGLPALRLPGVPDRHRRARHDRARPGLLRLRGGGVPGGHRVGAPVAAGRGALARPHPPRRHAAGRAPAGGPAGAAAVAQRLRRAAEGLRPDLRARRRRRDPGPRRSSRRARSTSRRTSWRACCSCCSRSPRAASPTRSPAGRPGPGVRCEHSWNRARAAGRRAGQALRRDDGAGRRGPRGGRAPGRHR